MSEAFSQPERNTNPDVGETDKLDDFWQQEKKTGEPEVKFKIAFGNHSKIEDLEFLKKDFDACDIYIPEMVTWTPELKEEWNKLSNGYLTADQLIEKLKVHNPDWQKDTSAEYEFSIARMIENSGKPIEYVDTYEPTQETMGVLSTWQTKLKAAESSEDKVAVMRQHFPIFGEFIKERENAMFQQIPNAVRDALDKKPELKQKPTVKVLLSLGAAHTPLFMKIKSIAPSKIERSFQEMPFLFGHFERIIRKMVLGGKVSDQEIEQAVLELEKGADLGK